jgi:hypothetical protein
MYIKGLQKYSPQLTGHERRTEFTRRSYDEKKYAKQTQFQTHYPNTQKNKSVSTEGRIKDDIPNTRYTIRD